MSRKKNAAFANVLCCLAFLFSLKTDELFGIMGIGSIQFLDLVLRHLVVLPVECDEPPDQGGQDIGQQDPVYDKDETEFFCFSRHDQNKVGLSYAYPVPTIIYCAAFVKNYSRSGG